MADTWKVTNQRQTTSNVAGTFVDAMQVTFETAKGDTGSVTVPLTSYSPDAVAAAIDDRVTAMDAVAEL